VSDAAGQILAALARWQQPGPEPLVVAIDGHGGAGKSTIAQAVASRCGAELVCMDSFFHAATPSADPRPLAQYYDWTSLRRRALEPVIARLRARAGARVILLEGVSSSAPALAELVNRSVLVATPEPVRLQRLRARVSAEEWDEAWLEAERAYFATRPPGSFDLVVCGHGGARLGEGLCARAIGVE